VLADACKLDAARSTSTLSGLLLRSRLQIRALVRGRGRVPARVGDLDLVRARALARALARARGLDDVRSLDLARTRALDRALDRGLVRARDLVVAINETVNRYLASGPIHGLNQPILDTTCSSPWTGIHGCNMRRWPTCARRPRGALPWPSA
jgi:hypothetical protein